MVPVMKKLSYEVDVSVVVSIVASHMFSMNLYPTVPTFAIPLHSPLEVIRCFVVFHQV
jgi:hypothetical protein